MRWLVVAAEPVTSVDVTAADTLAELHRALDADGIALRFAELKDPVKDKLRRFGLRLLGLAAVLYFLRPRETLGGQS